MAECDGSDPAYGVGRPTLEVRVSPNPGHTVFISYASQDASASERIASALRAAGVEVWFDRTELRGGDAWDRRIRQQIHDCRLFIPIISANTEARVEGYFRREWKLAADRTHDMSERVAFLVPVVVDGTSEAKADVPEIFRAVQWTRLPAGASPEAFVGRVAALLGAKAPVIVAATPAASQANTPHLQTPKRHIPWIALGLVSLLLAAGIGGLGWRHFSNSLSGGAQHNGQSQPPVNEKSIAVLPFVDMSEKHDQEYFSDGLAEELLDQLAKTPGLRVIARTSSFYFKGRQVPLAEIAKTLNVATVLEGSVRKAGDRVRVTTQLIRADSGEHLWSDSYDREMKDIFAVQDDITGEVVRALQVALQTKSTTGGGDRTANIEAYNLLLQGRYLISQGLGETNLQEAVKVLSRSVYLDPTYAPAWVQLGSAYFLLSGYVDRHPGPNMLLAREANQRVVALDPENAPGRYLSAIVKIAYDHNPEGAVADIEAAHHFDPSLVEPLELVVVSGCKSGPCYEKYMRDISRAIERDPLNPDHVNDRASVRGGAGDLAGAESDFRHLLVMNPGYDGARYSLATVLIQQHRAADAYAVAAAETGHYYRKAALAVSLLALNRRGEAEAQLKELVSNDAEEAPFEIAEVYAALGNTQAALDWLQKDYDDRHVGVFFFGSDLLLKTLATEPRFIALLKKIGYPLTAAAPN